MRPPSVPSRSHGQRTGVETSSSAPPPLRAARLSFARTKAALDGLNRPESRRMSGSLGPHLMKGDGIGPSASVTNWSTAASTVRSADTSSLKAKYDSAKRRRDAIVRLCRRTMGRPRLQISAHGAQRSAVRAQRARRASRGRAYSNRRRSSAPTSEGLRTPSSTRAQCCTRGATADLRLPGRGAGTVGDVRGVAGGSTELVVGEDVRECGHGSGHMHGRHRRGGGGDRRCSRQPRTGIAGRRRCRTAVGRQGAGTRPEMTLSRRHEGNRGVRQAGLGGRCWQAQPSSDVRVARRQQVAGGHRGWRRRSQRRCRIEGLSPTCTSSVRLRAARKNGHIQE